jgi:hypothetical protein
MRAFLLATPLAVALTVTSFGLIAAPAMATSETCAVAPAKLRGMAASADADAQRRAVRHIELGEALCDARNRTEATKKFNLAAKALGTDLATVMAAGTTASVQ